MSLADGKSVFSDMAVGLSYQVQLSESHMKLQGHVFKVFMVEEICQFGDTRDPRMISDLQKSFCGTQKAVPRMRLKLYRAVNCYLRCVHQFSSPLGDHRNLIAPSFMTTHSRTSDQHVECSQRTKRIEWASLVEIDISRFNEPREKQRLAAKLEDTVRNIGFWVVTGHGIQDEEVHRQLAIASAFFHLPMEEKSRYQLTLAMI